MTKRFHIAVMMSGVAMFALCVSAPAHAQGAAAEASERAFDVPAQPLSQAVLTFSQQAGVQLVLESGVAQGISSSAVSGRMSVAEAVTRLLQGTSLTWRFVNDRTITIEAAPKGEGERVLGAVRVEGEQGSPYFGGAGKMAGINGINGSRDITATEGTGSFTSGALTVGSKAPQALKDVPQSISVLTNERIEQQNVTDFTSAMRQLPGVTLSQGSTSLETTFYSRGFPIGSIQIDGGAPLVINTGYSMKPQIDMSIYDHVELLRGAAGQFGSYGNPGGTVNLVRKKPLDHSQYTLETQVGSWSNYRVVADATSPLALAGKLRGRLVMTWQDNEHFYNIAKDNKTLIYGIAEMDATPTTLLTAGVNYTHQNSVPWQGGLPRYLNGEDLRLPRSTALAFPWNRWNFDTTEIFGGIEQKFGNEWVLKINLTRNRQTSTQKIGYSSGAVNPTNKLGPQLNGVYNDYASKQFSAEATVSGSFNLFGQRQEVAVGVNRATGNGAGAIQYAQLVTGYPEPYYPYPGGPAYCTDYGQGCPEGSIPTNPPIDVFAFDAEDALYTEPRNPLPRYYYPENRVTQSAAYVSLRLTAFDRLHLTTGLRWSRYESAASYDILCLDSLGDCASKSIGDAFYSGPRNVFGADDFSWPPPVNLSFDVTKAITVYAGYTDIYQSQASSLDEDLNPLPPVTGSNWEGGLKWAARNGKLNLSLAAYHIRKKGFGIVPDSSNFYTVRPGVYCCYVVGSNQIYDSKGVDAELTGEIAQGFQIAANYTFNDNQQMGSLFGSGQGQPFVSISPKHLYKIWMSYDFGAAGYSGALSRLMLSGGVNGQSSGYNAGSTCVRFTGDPDPLTGAQPCAPNDDPDNPSRVNYYFTVPAHALLSGRIDYRVSDNWSLAVNLENILDKTYYQTTGAGVTGGNWYGEPRSVTFSLRGKW